MFKRVLASKITSAAASFAAVSVVGPRQSGKTTLLKLVFPKHEYLNLEDPDTLAAVKLDPKALFDNKTKKWIIDEAQEYPELFSFLLGIIDKNQIKGQFILSCSKNFILFEKISQSLAGRVAIFELMPLTFNELTTQKGFADIDVWDLIYSGSYPGPYHEKMDTDLWYKSYVTTYLQRDVRQLINVKDLSKFHLFLRLCAGRHGQLLNLSELGNACGVSHTAVKEWINLLELSYIVYRLPPFYKNYDKRLVKTPKLYFYDSGLVCHLLNIESGEHAKIHASRGALFEGFVISELKKSIMHRAKEPNMYFWNNQNGFEIDCLIEGADKIKVIEAKSSSTFSESFLKQCKKWLALTQDDVLSECYIAYSGNKKLNVKGVHVTPYTELQDVLK